MSQLPPGGIPAQGAVDRGSDAALVVGSLGCADSRCSSLSAAGAVVVLAQTGSLPGAGLAELVSSSMPRWRPTGPGNRPSR